MLCQTQVCGVPFQIKVKIKLIYKPDKAECKHLSHISVRTFCFPTFPRDFIELAIHTCVTCQLTLTDNMKHSRLLQIQQPNHVGRVKTTYSGVAA